jgi:hypothetical protein
MPGHTKPTSANFGFLAHYDGTLVAVAGQAERFFQLSRQT